MRSLVIDSPAKINLALRVVGKRKDGFHELVTLFHRISLKDELVLRKKETGIRLVCSHPRVPIEGNLTIKAFHLLKKHHPFKGGVSVTLQKKIPVGGGLGGGSSNAAAFLLGVNRLFRLGLSRQKLMEIGAELGADVPFFISKARHAIGLGRGDRISSLPFKRRLWFLLFPSGRGLSTRKVFGAFRAGRRLTEANHDVRMGSAFLEQGDLNRAGAFLKNDLQEVAERIRPSLKKTKKTLSALHLGICQMSGSGPTLFITLTSSHKAKQAFNELRRKQPQQKVILCHSEAL